MFEGIKNNVNLLLTEMENESTFFIGIFLRKNKVFS